MGGQHTRPPILRRTSQNYTAVLQCATPFYEGRMANSTIIYACTDDGLAIFNRPGTLPEWLPPRRVLRGVRVGAAWGEPGPPMRVLVIGDGKLLLSENGGRTWVPVGPEGVE